MDHTFENVAIIGVGLLGGSLGLALKRRGLAARIYGVGRNENSLDTALNLGAIDEASLDIATAVKDADLIVLCTPAAAVPGQLDTVREACRAGAVVTDVASTKRCICEHASATWPAPRRFVGSHPMAGSEKFGPGHANAELFDGAVTFVERGGTVDLDAYKTAIRLWESVGSTVVGIEPGQHDEMVARTSHVPHIVASAIAQLVGEGKESRHFIGNGFRDATRIAEGRPELWRDICLTNPTAIEAALTDLIERLESVRQSVAEENGGQLESFFAESVRARRELLDS
jgi:prephenate dehydrogenase